MKCRFDLRLQSLGSVLCWVSNGTEVTFAVLMRGVFRMVKE